MYFRQQSVCHWHAVCFGLSEHLPDLQQALSLALTLVLLLVPLHVVPGLMISYLNFLPFDKGVLAPDNERVLIKRGQIALGVRQILR